MKFPRFILIVALVFAFSGLIHAADTPAADSGYVPLFNGKDWDGWYLKLRKGDDALARQVFAIEDGGIHVFASFPDKYESDNGGNATHGLCYTTKKFSRYSFRFEYKWGKKTANNFDQYQYDAGCFYHVSNDKIWPVGIEYQVRYNHVADRNHTGDFLSPPGTKIQWYSAEGTTFTSRKDGGKPQPYKRGEHRALATATHHTLNGQWNQCEIIVMGNQYAIHKLNGIVVNYATNLSHSEGIIGLQSETAEIYYRKIEIKEFAEDVPMESFLK